MRRRDFLKKAGLASATIPFFSLPRASAETGKKILYFERSTGYVHPPTIHGKNELSTAGRVLQQLGRQFGREVICTKEGNLFDGDLNQYDAFIFYTCGQLDGPAADKSSPISPDGRKKFFDAIRNGKSFLGIHSATDTWKTPGPKMENQPPEQLTDYTKMVGAQFITHGSQQETTMVVTDNTLPWLRKQGRSFRFFDEWYAMKNFNPDMHVLLVQDPKGMDISGGNDCYNRPPFPSTWVRQEGKGRVAYTALGHNNSAWEGKDAKVVPEVITDLLRFLLHEQDLDLTPNIQKVCPEAFTLKRNG